MENTGKVVAIFGCDIKVPAEGVQMPKLGEYLQIKEAAEYLGVCRKTLRNWEASGKLVVYRHPINNYRLYRIADLDKLICVTEDSVTVKPKRKPR